MSHKRRGWCPTLHEPMATGDGLLVRVKPRGGALSGAAAQGLADAADRYGNGVIELTARAHLQIRGLSLETVAPFARAMVAAALASPDPAAERRRAVIATPLTGIDPAVHPATRAITDALETALEAAAGLPALPSKFGFLVDGGGILPPDGSADIAIRLIGENAALVLDGGEGAAFVPITETVAAAIRLAEIFVARPGTARRMRGLVGEIGERALFAAASLEHGLAPARTPSATAVGPHVGAFGAGLPFGSGTAAQWRALGKLGDLRLSPWRVVFVEAFRDADALRALGLIVTADDPLLRVSACPGQPGCASASVVTRDLAARLRPAAETAIHVSGCDKGCAHPGPATRTLVGRAGRFDLVQNGAAADLPICVGLTAAEVLSL